MNVFTKQKQREALPLSDNRRRALAASRAGLPRRYQRWDNSLILPAYLHIHSTPAPPASAALWVEVGALNVLFRGLINYQ